MDYKEWSRREDLIDKVVSAAIQAGNHYKSCVRCLSGKCEEEKALIAIVQRCLENLRGETNQMIGEPSAHPVDRGAKHLLSIVYGYEEQFKYGCMVMVDGQPLGVIDSIVVSSYPNDVVRTVIRQWQKAPQHAFLVTATFVNRELIEEEGGHLKFTDGTNVVDT